MYPYFETPAAKIKLPWYVRLVDRITRRRKPTPIQFGGYKEPTYPTGWTGKRL